MSNKSRKNKKRNYHNTGYIFIIPFVAVFMIFSIYPVFRTLYLSFMEYKGYGEPTFLGLDNYARVLKDKFFWIALGNTIRIWVVNIVLQLGIAFLLTIIFSDIKYRIKGLGFFRAIFYIPNIIAATSIAFLFSTFLDWRFGSFNQLLSLLGINQGNPTDWLGSVNVAPYTVAVIGAWMWFGSSFIMLMAGVQGINTDYFEAAAIDGAGRWKTFSKITIPLLKPILVYVGITSLIGGLQMFDLPFLMSGGTAGNPSGRLQTAIMYLYKFGFENNQVGYAAAIAYTLFGIILIVSVVQYRLMYRKED